MTGESALKPLITNALLNGEGQRIEFKERVTDWSDLAKEVCAFANTNDGVVLIGVDDHGKVIGFTHDKDRVLGAVRSVDPLPIVEVDVLPFEDLAVCIISVHKGDTPPYVVGGRVYVRSGSHSIPASAQEIRAIVAADSDRPRFARTSGGFRRFPDSIEPSWRFEQIAGDVPPYIEWRFRHRSIANATWQQLPTARLSRASLSGKISLSAHVPTADSMIANDEIGVEFRCLWRGQFSHELHTWQLIRPSRELGEKFDVGPERPPSHWTEPLPPQAPE